MTRATVVDASALAAVLFDEAGSAHVARRLDDGELIAPALLEHELCQVLLTKIRQTPAKAEALVAAWRKRELLRIAIYEPDFEAVRAAASRYRLSAYDAAYLVLALQSDADLMTRDKLLAAAWRRAR